MYEPITAQINYLSPTANYAFMLTTASRSVNHDAASFSVPADRLKPQRKDYVQSSLPKARPGASFQPYTLFSQGSPAVASSPTPGGSFLAAASNQLRHREAP